MVSGNCVSEFDFYPAFESLDDCLLAAFEEGVERVRQLIVDAAGCERNWRKLVRTIVLALLVFLDEEPGWARLLIDDTPIASPAVAERRQAALGGLARALASETQARANNTGWFLPSSELTAELIVGGVFSGLRTHLLEGVNEPVVQLAPALVAFIEAPYRASGLLSDTLEKGGEANEVSGQRVPVRTTYRTTRVLCAVGESPGLSNREIADAAGLVDEGQTSKLLRRLEGHGLIENFGIGQTHGGPNAWSLTAYGERVRDATRHSLVPGVGDVISPRARGAA